MEINSVFVFNGENSHFPSAIFSNKDKAIEWIKHNNANGVLTKYPIYESIYDWALSNNYFKPKNDLQKSSKFKSNFSSAYLEHYHFENGVEI